MCSCNILSTLKKIFTINLQLHNCVPTGWKLILSFNVLVRVCIHKKDFVNCNGMFPKGLGEVDMKGWVWCGVMKI